jgi:hypothetical protein
MMGGTDVFQRGSAVIEVRYDDKDRMISATRRSLEGTDVTNDKALVLSWLKVPP